MTDLHPILAQRWSPAHFDDSHHVEDQDIAALVEAARWAPSAGNSQPWMFIIGRRGTDRHRRMVRHLAGSSVSWASQAAVLVANLSHRFVEDTDWEYSEFSHYDLGQAVAHMSVQAQAMGLFVRQFRAFNRARLTEEFAVPPHWEVTTMSAIGRPPVQSAMEAVLTRDRRSHEELLWAARGV